MGLDTTHNAWHGAYSAFHRWRVKLAEVVGIPLELMEGFYGGQIAETADRLTAGKAEPPLYIERLRDYDALLPITWDILKPDVLHFLLHHSDCDGDIPAELCSPLADRLEELLPLLEGDGGGHVGDYRQKTQKFIDGLRLAASLGEAVEFL
jgi:hypothetical protein